MIQCLHKALEANSRPKKTPHDSILLRHGKENTVLVNTNGALTKAGTEYEKMTKTTLMTFSYENEQTPIRKGNQEFIKLRRGRERLIRTYDPTANDGQGSYKYTQVGKRFFANQKTNYFKL